MNQKAIKITVMDNCEYYDLMVRQEETIEDLKNQIGRRTNLKLPIFYYLFYNNRNLLDFYNGYTIGRVMDMDISSDVEIKNEDQPLIAHTDHIFYVINREDYTDLLESIDCLKCHYHPFNMAYLFCNQCNELICDKCKHDTHADHVRITDQALCLDSFYMKLQQYERKFRHLFGKSKLSDLDRKISEMINNLTEHHAEEKADIIKLAKDMKASIDSICELELKRLDRFIDAGKEKINEFEDDCRMVFKMYKDCKDGLSTRQYNIDTFAKQKPDKKIEFLQSIQKQNLEMIQKATKIEKVLEKFQNLQEYEVYRLLEANKDHSYSVTFVKLKQIFDKKYAKMTHKIETENCELLIEKMEKIKSKMFSAKVYNRLLNLNEATNQQDCIMQSIDDTNTLNLFIIKEKKIEKHEVRFLDNPGGITLNSFPKFSRSINIMNKLYVVGGEIESGIINYLIEVDSRTFLATMKKGMYIIRAGSTLVNINNLNIIVISGAYGEKSCEIYDIEKNFWSALPNVHIDRIGPSALVYCSETVFLFYGKRYDSNNRKWEYVETIEKINLFEKYPQWINVNFKAKNFNILNHRAFSSLIACPNEKVFLIGGQIFEDNRTQLTTNALEIDMENMSIGNADLTLPRECVFIDSNYYFHNSNAYNFDNEGTVLMYSVIFHEMWNIENY